MKLRNQTRLVTPVPLQPKLIAYDVGKMVAMVLSCNGGCATFESSYVLVVCTLNGRCSEDVFGQEFQNGKVDDPGFWKPNKTGKTATSFSTFKNRKLMLFLVGQKSSFLTFTA